MLLPFMDDRLTQTWRCDPEMSALADRHYSRQSLGAREFMGNGKTLVLRDQKGLVVFGWLWQPERNDGQRGYNCTIFRNEGPRLSSEIILEAEQVVTERWGANRLFTFINPTKIRSPNPGFCFKCAGWHRCGVSGRGYQILEKFPLQR
jgi:hypothetical protein